MRPKISICIATYNGERYIAQQLDSILPQLSSDDEIIISDDGSNDSTIDIIYGFADSRIKLIKNPREKGYTSNFENALIHCNNDIIFLSDQDDIWIDNKISSCLSELENADFIVHDAIITDSNLSAISESYFKERGVYNGFSLNILKFGYLGCCFAFKKKILDKAIPFPSNHKLCTHDNWLFLIAERYFRTKIISNKLIFYRRHISNTSTGGKKKNLDLIFMIKYRLYILYNIIKRSNR